MLHVIVVFSLAYRLSISSLLTFKTKRLNSHSYSASILFHSNLLHQIREHYLISSINTLVSSSLSPEAYDTPALPKNDLN